MLLAEGIPPFRLPGTAGRGLGLVEQSAVYALSQADFDPALGIQGDFALDKGAGGDGRGFAHFPAHFADGLSV